MPSRHSRGTKIIGLTGGIASGKNFVADLFAKRGAAIFDADKEVHKLLEIDKSTIEEVKKNFPESFCNKKIDRKLLGKIVFLDEKKLHILEKILHPKVRENYQKFLHKAQEEERRFIVLNIPLLLESQVYKYDYLLAITAPIAVRERRFLERSKDADIKKFTNICAHQLTDLEREKRADFIINNGGSKDDAISQLEDIIKEIS